MKNILIPTKLDAVARELLEAKGFSVVQDADTPLLDLVKAQPDTAALIVRSEKVTAEVIDALPKLRLVVRAGAGYNTIDTKHARKRGVDVMNTPGANANAVAEEVIALVLAHYRHLVPADQSTRAGRWEKKSYMGRELTGRTVGIVGLGNIGQLVVKRLTGFEARILAYDPIVSAARAEDLGVELVDLETLFAQSDVVTLHIPETDETRGMVNRDLLSRMKTGATLVNCARSGVLVEEDLRALKAEKKLGFCNDVYAADKEGEKSCADIADIMVPHLGANTEEANFNAARRAAEQLVAYAEQGVTRYVVNRGVPEGLDEVYQQLAYQLATLGRSYFQGAAVCRVECSLYGGLDEFAKWLAAPIAAGLSADFDAFEDIENPEEYLAAKGIAFELRSSDDSKGYGRSITLDMQAGRDTLQQLSLRGTVAEGNTILSRLNRFDRLYCELRGHNLLVEYEDRPGVLAKITSACAQYNINIEDIRAPRDPSGTRALALLKTDSPVPASALKQLRQEVGTTVVFTASLD
jgi:D-3-phosphoglycerate dehydrogenase